MTTDDAIRTVSKINGSVRFEVSFDAHCESFEFAGDETDWFFACLDAMRRLAEEWHLDTPPRVARLAVRREAEDRGPYPWLQLTHFAVTQAEFPWIDLEEFEQDRAFLFMFGRALAMAWRSQDCAKIVGHFRPKEES